MKQTTWDRRTLLGALGGGALGLAAGPLLGGGPGRRRPNIVLILVDDLGWRDVGCNGSTFFDTPHIDGMARAGLRCTDGYAACPVCSPTRASLLAGKYPARMRLTDWLVGTRWPGKSPLLPVRWAHAMALEEVTLAEALRAAGYATGHVGKWHLGHPRRYWPREQGFDENHGGHWSGHPRSYYWPAWRGNPPLAAQRPGRYLTDHLTDCALEFITRHRERPFFLHLSHYGVHTPIQPKTEYVTKYRSRAAGERHQNNPLYGAMVQSIDDSVGRVLAHLDRLGLARDTLVIFTSDNGGLSTREGPHTPATSNHPLRAGKGHLYEGGIRVPWLFRWPGVIAPGRVSAAPVCSIDLYPTALAAAGLGAPRGQVLDGVDLLPRLRGGAPAEERDLFWHYPHYSNQGGRPGSAIRRGPWKLIRSWETGREELYRLDRDAGERTDLARTEPDRRRQLAARLDRWLAAVGAQIPRHKG